MPGGAFKALAQWFPEHRLPLLNGLVMAVGGFGGVVVGSPLNALLRFTDWRVICFGLAAVTVSTSVRSGSARLTPRILTGKQDSSAGARRGPCAAQPRILEDCVAGGHGARGLLCDAIAVDAPYMRDVIGLNAHATATLVSVVALAMMAGCVGFGAVARRQEHVA